MAEKIITKKDVEYVSRLARVHLKPEELDQYTAQLERILGYIAKLKEKNTENVPPTAHPLAVVNVWREDEAHPFPDIPAILENAPEKEGTFYKVMKVIE